jgi:hypothetical protein
MAMVTQTSGSGGTSVLRGLGLFVLAGTLAAGS